MSNILNSLTTDIDNVVAAKKLSKKKAATSKVILAPQKLPKYSITAALEEKDEFRRNVLGTNYEVKKKKNRRNKLFFVALASVVSVLWIRYCKKKCV